VISWLVRGEPPFLDLVRASSALPHLGFGRGLYNVFNAELAFSHPKTGVRRLVSRTLGEDYNCYAESGAGCPAQPSILRPRAGTENLAVERPDPSLSHVKTANLHWHLSQ
jgi:hypothetical protein